MERGKYTIGTIVIVFLVTGLFSFQLETAFAQKLPLRVYTVFGSSDQYYAGLKLQALANQRGWAGKEIFLGMAGFTSSVHKDLAWGLDCKGAWVRSIWGTNNDVVLEYQPQVGMLIARIDTSAIYCFSYPVGDLGIINAIQVNLVNLNNGTQVGLNDVKVNGLSVGDFSSLGKKSWIVRDKSLTDGFVLKGNLTLAWSPDVRFQNPEHHKVEIMIGFALPKGDINMDQKVDVVDLTLIGQVWGLTGEPGWILEDVVADGLINILDLTAVGSEWGETW